MATAYHQPVDAFNATPDGQQIFVPTAKYNSYRERQYAPRMNPSRSSSYNDYPIEKQGFDNNIGMSPDTQQQQQLQQQQQNAQSGMYDNAISVMPSPYESSQQHQQQQLQSQPQSQPFQDPGDRRSYTQVQFESNSYMNASAPYPRDSYRQSKDDSGIYSNDVRPPAEAPPEAVIQSESPVRQSLVLQQTPTYDTTARPLSSTLPTSPRHTSLSLANATGNGVVPPRHSTNISSSGSQAYKPSIPISSTARAVAQQPTYITPPSSPTPIAVNPVYNYAPDASKPAVVGTKGSRYTQGYGPPGGFVPPEGKEICVECAMRDQDMADVDVTSPGVWDRESDVYYEELCRQEALDEEERVRTKNSNSSSESQHQVILRNVDPTRPRARGNRLTEPNLKLWLSMNPREPQSRQQNIDLYVKTQTALLEAEALARARAMQESRLLETKLKDTYDNLRRSTHELPSGMTSSHNQKRSVSGPAPLGPIVVDGASGHSRHQSQGREVTLLENGMIVEHVDVRKEEKERRREEKRERERERSRARKSSRSSGNNGNGAAEVMSMYSAHSPLPNHVDSGFYSAASNGSMAMLAREQRDRPMSLSQSSTRAMSVTPGPLTPPPGSAGMSISMSARPSTTRVHSQVSLVDSQSISSASLGANRRSRFFAFRNWSEAWKSRESFAPSAVMSMNGSMMDMHLALDREKQMMQRMRPTTVDLGSAAPTMRHSETFPRRASFSGDRNVTTDDLDRPKKKKGLSRIWGFVTKHRHSKHDVTIPRGQDIQPTERNEDDMPLAPPPPLSYLVNRTPRERSMSNASRRTSMPLPSQPASATTLPTPTSIRNTWLEDGTRPVTTVLPAHTEESANLSGNNGYLSADVEKTIHPVLSEPDMRQRAQDDPNNNGQGLPAPTIRAPGSPRPISVYSLHKSLPPLPGEVAASQSIPSPVDAPRPMTMYDMGSSSGGGMGVPLPQEDELSSPQPYFRRDVRRQSFGGMSSRPDRSTLGQSFDSPAGYGYGYGYNEMGASTMRTSRSVGRLGGMDGSVSPAGMNAAANSNGSGAGSTFGKRRSRFGIASLLGKMTGSSRASEGRLSVVGLGLNPGSSPSSGFGSSASGTGASGSGTFGNNGSGLYVYEPEKKKQSPPPSDSEGDAYGEGGSPSGSGTEYGNGNGGGSSRSRHHNGGGMGSGSGSGLAPPSRMSVASRRAIEELVDQDPNFVAYRYPSVDQNIALFR